MFKNQVHGTQRRESTLARRNQTNHYRKVKTWSIDIMGAIVGTNFNKCATTRMKKENLRTLMEQTCNFNNRSN